MAKRQNFCIHQMQNFLIFSKLALLLSLKKTVVAFFGGHPVYFERTESQTNMRPY